MALKTGGFCITEKPEQKWIGREDCSAELKNGFTAYFFELLHC